MKMSKKEFETIIKEYAGDVCMYVRDDLDHKKEESRY